MIFGKFKELFFAGIGGAGMSGIAEILHNLGYEISGSDIGASSMTRYLESLGITIHIGHRPENLGQANVLVISSAIREDNPEIAEARRRGIPVIKRAEMLGELMRLKYSIGVAGTHGKTTTTSMVGHILLDARLEPTVIVGGIVAGKGSGASLGSGDYFVAEADEYDRSFLAMFPSMALVTNIEPDHMECYNGLDDLHNSFLTYMNRVPFYGLVVYSADDPTLWKLRSRITRASISFGFNPGADYRGVELTMTAGGSTFGVFKREQYLGRLDLYLPGRHNARNALGAAAAAMELEVPFDTVAESLSRFRGVARRFEIKEIVNDIIVVDDYAHHPSEIEATLKAAREAYDRRIICIFQPHLFSRTLQFYEAFAETLKNADVCLLTDIFPAREQPIKGVTSEIIEKHARSRGYDNIRCVGVKENAVGAAVELARPGDLIITMGAGSITHINPEIISELKK